MVKKLIGLSNKSFFRDPNPCSFAVSSKKINRPSYRSLPGLREPAPKLVFPELPFLQALEIESLLFPSLANSVSTALPHISLLQNFSCLFFVMEESPLLRQNYPNNYNTLAL